MIPARRRWRRTRGLEAEFILSPCSAALCGKRILMVPDQPPIRPPARNLTLTPREQDVLSAILDGKSNREAGENLGISPRTIEVHRARIMRKLGARNTVQLVKNALLLQLQQSPGASWHDDR
jgi:DNA-binding NarL/FixJ family response regulator